LIDLSAIARRHNLTIDGAAIPIGPGRIVTFGAAELAYTTSAVDSPAGDLMRAKIARIIYRTPAGVTVAFAPARLRDVLAIVGRRVEVAA
jgi:hypothetical protein